MKADWTGVLIVAATAATGVLAGASLDQSIKQLPARRRMGVIAFALYSRAADLGNGVLWYSILGISAALLTLAAAASAWAAGIRPGCTAPLGTAAVLAILHSLTTIKAAPINFSQRDAGNDQSRLTDVFNRFERWQTIRCVLQTLNFCALLWAMAVA